jgi:D-beta-D-heptose 7-phosphate kinase/D-beta-D-heptose 1-phosphate adenosyltransferase
MFLPSTDRLEELLARAATVRVAVVGDVMLDIYLTGSASRISPEAPVPVVHVTEERVALGGAANVAANVLALGAECEIVGCIGADAAGRQLHAALEAQGSGTVVPRLLERAERPTTTKTRVMARHQQVVRFDREDAGELPDDAIAELAAAARQAVAAADVLILEDYNKGVLSPVVIRAALDTAAEVGIPSVIDPKFRNFFAYGGATVFKPNALELSTAFGGAIDLRDDDALAEVRRRLDCEHLLLTLGEDGMALHSGGSTSLRIPALAREVYDVSGAGDTVIAYTATMLAAGADIEEAAMLANAAAAIEVGKPGVAPVLPGELLDFLALRAPADALTPHLETGIHGRSA